MVKKDVKAVVELSNEDKKKLEELASDIERSRKAITALSELGMNVIDLENKLTWAVKAREVLLRDFT